MAADIPPDDAERQRKESDCEFNFIISRIAPDYADPGAYLVMWEEGQPQNRCNIPFPKLWALWDQQATSLDPRFRAGIVEQMEDILINDEEEGCGLCSPTPWVTPTPTAPRRTGTRRRYFVAGDASGICGRSSSP